MKLGTVSFSVAALLAGCAATSHPTTGATLGTPKGSAAMEAVINEPGPLTLETVAAADWQVDRGGLIDLNNPTAKAAGVTDGPEPIQIFVHVVRHPTRGMYFVDSGVERAFETDPGHALIHGFLASAAHIDKLKVRENTAALVAREAAPVAGVFLTHLHLDHVLGLPDLAPSVPVFVGAGDVEQKSFLNLLMKSVFEASLEGKGPLAEFHFTSDPNAVFDGILDVFGDGSLWAISVPGHTPGSIAYLVRTTTGPVLLTGDACHTAWGWKHDVSPGSFSWDVAKSQQSLDRLEHLVERHPKIDVRPGHQSLPHAP